MKLGYARVSTATQDLELQHAQLLAAGCVRIFSDTASGRRVDRPGLEELLNHARAGDTVVVWKLDRFGRSVKDLIDLVGDLERRDVAFHSLTETIDTSTSGGRLFFHVMASIAQMDIELIIERTRAGLDAARKEGRIGGRRSMPVAVQEAAEKLLRGGMEYPDVARTLKVSTSSLYKYFPAGKI